jgi:hypothetical protein
MQLFAGHLPISPNTIFPQSATDKQFDAIFKPKPQWLKYKETADQLEGVIVGLEGAVPTSSENNILMSEEPTIHLDASSTPALAVMQDPLQEYYRTNRPPPPPRPIEEFGTEKKVVRKRGRKGKSWQTTITVTEWTDGKGRRTFAADSTPIVRVSQASQLQKIIEEPTMDPKEISVPRQPFLQRMQARQLRWVEGKSIRSPLGKKPRMLLISVKRQRKAKMKKHKLKKLRKRTRNERRKLGKL